MQRGVFLVLRGWLGYVISKLNSGRYTVFKTYFTEIYKKKLPYIIQATNEVMFLSWSLIERQNKFFCYTIYIETNVLARICGYDVIRETAKSWAKYPQSHLYVSLIYSLV